MMAAAHTHRRSLLQSAGALSLVACGMPPARASTAAPPTALDATATSLLGNVLGVLDTTSSPVIALQAPAIADNGAVVPIELTCMLPDAKELYVLVDVNPEPLALRFAVPEGTQPFIATRIRMAASGTVIAAVRTAGGAYHAVSRNVQVTVGGCG